jgi:hypothetical protein
MVDQLCSASEHHHIDHHIEHVEGIPHLYYHKQLFVTASPHPFVVTLQTVVDVALFRVPFTARHQAQTVICTGNR